MNLSTLFRDLEKVRDFVKSVDDLAKLHGASENCTGVNSIKFLAKKLRDYQELEETAQELGYKSAKYALYGARKRNRYPNVPEDLQHAPDHWVHGVKIEKMFVFRNSKQIEKQYKVPACTALQARKKLESILPHLDKLLENCDKEYLQEVREFFKDPDNDFEDFSSTVLGQLAEQSNIDLVEPIETLA